MQIVSSGDYLHEKSNPVFWENKKNISKCLPKTFTQSAKPDLINVQGRSLLPENTVTIVLKAPPVLNSHLYLKASFSGPIKIYPSVLSKHLS